jgi:hypothetical protein
MKPYDAFLGKLIRLLTELDLEMHTPQKGETWTCRRRPKNSLRISRTTTGNAILVRNASASTANTQNIADG